MEEPITILICSDISFVRQPRNMGGLGARTCDEVAKDPSWRGIHDFLQLPGHATRGYKCRKAWEQVSEEEQLWLGVTTKQGKHMLVHLSTVPRRVDSYGQSDEGGDGLLTFTGPDASATDKHNKFMFTSTLVLEQNTPYSVDVPEATHPWASQYAPNFTPHGNRATVATGAIRPTEEELAQVASI
jgi:hypothetical protein